MEESQILESENENLEMNNAHSSTLLKNDKRTINGWCMYDWANS